MNSFEENNESSKKYPNQNEESKSSFYSDAPVKLKDYSNHTEQEAFDHVGLDEKELAGAVLATAIDDLDYYIKYPTRGNLKARWNLYEWFFDTDATKEGSILWWINRLTKTYQETEYYYEIIIERVNETIPEDYLTKK